MSYAFESFVNNTSKFTLCYYLHNCSHLIEVTLSTRLSPYITTTRQVWLHNSLTLTITRLALAYVLQLRCTHSIKKAGSLISNQISCFLYHTLFISKIAPLHFRSQHMYSFDVAYLERL